MTVVAPATNPIERLRALISRQDIPQEARETLFTITSEISPLQNDRWVYRLVVVVLGLTLLSTVLGILFLTYTGHGEIKLPDSLVALGSAAGGALAGLLAPSPLRSGS
jgi:hypothetical protein